jgi:hypothetical protein
VVLGFIVASFNYLSTGQIAGSGKDEVLLMLGGTSLGLDFVAMKYFATLTSLASTIPGVIHAKHFNRCGHWFRGLLVFIRRSTLK